MTGHSSLLLVTVVGGVAVVMTRVGVGLGLLRERAWRRHCAACGRKLGRRGCKRCGV